MDCIMSVQPQKLTKLLEFLRKTCKLNGETAHDSWFDILTCDDPEEDVLAYCFCWNPRGPWWQQVDGLFGLYDLDKVTSRTAGQGLKTKQKQW